jgi:hypothetical protein
MNHRLKSIILFVVDIRSFIVYFAVFNFILIWRWNASITFACVVCPWYHPWSYFNAPTVLLVAAAFLRLNQWWAHSIAMALAGYVIGWVIYLLSLVDNPWAALRAEWKISREWYPYFVGSWDSQYVFALIICGCSGVYLMRDILRRRKLLPVTSVGG